jgi:hypothetical protein
VFESVARLSFSRAAEGFLTQPAHHPGRQARGHAGNLLFDSSARRSTDAAGADTADDRASSAVQLAGAAMGQFRGVRGSRPTWA